MTDTDTDTVARLVARLAHLRHRSQNPRAGQALWYVVSQLLGYGCTHANEWCTAHGLDPNMRTKGVRW